jgi:hypothetical protein
MSDLSDRVAYEKIRDILLNFEPKELVGGEYFDKARECHCAVGAIGATYAPTFFKNIGINLNAKGISIAYSHFPAAFQNEFSAEILQFLQKANDHAFNESGIGVSVGANSKINRQARYKHVLSQVESKLKTL